MNAAVAAAFIDGAERVVVIGTDCPILDESHLTNAFQQLQDHDVVIGPTDGRMVAILKGLAPGDQVVTQGGTALTDGMKVRTQ